MGRSKPKSARNFRNNPDLYFQYRLARELHITVQELHTKMSMTEYAHWVQFYLYEEEMTNKAIALQQAEMRKR